MLDHGADIDALDKEYQSTPLGLAARWGQREMVNQLIARGADPNLAGAEWASPLSWSQKKKHLDIAKDLESAGAVS